MDLVRQEIMTGADTIVVKVGTRVLTGGQGKLEVRQVESIASQLALLWHSGRRVALVSSGAVGAGLGRLGAGRRPDDLADLQAAAAIGQSCLIEAYNRALQPHDLHAAQVLLTAGDLQDRKRYLNVRNTIFALFRAGAVPIINENDTVSTEELQLSFGDNDRLAALVTQLIRAPLLVLLSDIDGLYDGDPSDPASKVLPLVTDLDRAQSEMVHDGRPFVDAHLSLGGMAGKLQAARIATTAGENVVIANGWRDGVLQEIIAGNQIGTLLLAEGKAVASRKRWIGWSARPRGRLTLDAGAERAIQSEGRSLLAVGVVDVEGRFDKGDVVGLIGGDGHEIARGLTNYSVSEMRTIAGHPTDCIAQLLGHCPYDEAIHRDHLVLL